MTKKYILSAVPNKDKKLELTKYCPVDFYNQPTLNFFSKESVNFLNDLSDLLLKRSDIRTLPELMALAFWIRKGNIVPLVENWQNNLSDNEIVRPRGIAFHVAPSNVDSIFIYSFSLSLLCGNSNLIRISNRRSNQIEILFECIGSLYKKHPKIASRNKFFTYEHDEHISNYFSINADLRILWGGDNTVNMFKKFDSKANVKDVTFSDKKSLSIINTNFYLKLNKAEKTRLAHSFYNDSYWFDQMACSSPGRVYFIGNNSAKASKIFWDYLSKEIIKNNTLDDQSLSIKKLTSLYSEIINNKDLEPIISGRNDMPTVILQKRNLNISPNCGGGFFIEGRLTSLNELSEVIGYKDQTIGYFGFDFESIKKLFHNKNILSIDRIVPIGQALNFNSLWDGYDLFSEFTKRLNII